MPLSRSRVSYLVGGVAAICGLAPTLVAATSPVQQDPPDRQHFVFHVYVDPLFGDDALATAQNPTALPQQALQYHPEPGTPQPIGGVLQQAPFAFRTLTAANGALAYVNQFLPIPNATGGMDFYTVDLDPGPGTHLVDIQHVVIHCLPGVYGPIVGGLPDIDPASGLPFNGEVWPAVIPDRVSLQGTSHLDTIFDGRLQEVNILAVRQPAATNFPDTHAESFVDSLTIRRARASEQLVRGTGAGIYVSSPTTLKPCYVTITNCVLSDNVIGMAFDSWNGTENRTPQRCRIVNNTLAWNAIGLWAGDTGGPNTSIHELFVINNVFDSGNPVGYIPGLSGFEGLSSAEKQVVQRGAVMMNADFNAWEDAPVRVNLAVALLPNWPATAPATGGPPWVGPAVNVRPYTLAVAGRPGALYLNDVFRASPVGGVGVEYSPHDFRLAPMVTTDINNPPGNQTPEPRNPLVGAGVDAFEGGGGAFLTIQTGNGQQLQAPPGLPPGSEEARVDGWDWDGEGFGNPRIQQRPGFPDVNMFGNVDIGADEMGNLIMGGYIDGTRIYSQSFIPNAPAITDHFDVYFFDLASLGARQRPETNFYVGDYILWWTHVQAGPDGSVGNYTDVVWDFNQNPLQFPERMLDVLQNAYEPIMRGRICDFSPHLQPDWHPLWGSFLTGRPGVDRGDVYGSNGWYGHSMPPMLPTPLTTRDNPALYHNLGGTGSSRWFYDVVFVLDAHINPPGSFLLLQPGRFTVPPTTRFGPYAPCGNPASTTYTVGVWGYGDTAAGCPDRIPQLPFQEGNGLRMNCEVIVNGATTSNLQTFLGIWNSGIGEQSAQRPSPDRAVVAPLAKPTPEAMGAIVRRSLEWSRRR